ncbi:MetQ/NlpA family ABC transporter substrate-binding protein [Dermacoccaceae bacterium W4C1]
MSSPATSALPDNPNRGSRRNTIIAVVVVAALILAVVAWRVSASQSGSEDLRTIKIGTTEESSPYWQPLKEAARKEGIVIETVQFNDYTQANPALAQKQIDLNLFQHLQFLAAYNVNAKQNLTPVGSTVVVPLPLYSKKHTKLSQIPQGGKIAIPNDETNQARALLVLQAAGLLKLKGGGNALSTPADIDASASKVTVSPVDAAQTVAALPSVDGAIINNNFALTAKLDPTSALYQDDPSKPEAEPYINSFVARAADKNDPDFATIVKLYRTPAVSSKVRAESKNTAVLVNRPNSELETILARLEKDLEAK